MTASHHWAGALALALVFAGSANAALAPASQASQLSQVQTALGGLSIPFEANSGQWDAQVAYKAQTFAGQVFVTREGRIVYSLPGPVQEKASIQDKAQPQAKTQPVTRAPGWSLVETLVGAQPLAPSASQAAPTHISRFQGNSTYQAATYHSVQLGQAWPGVAVELTAHGNNVEKLFHVAPGADAGQIQVQLQGAKTLRLGEQGQLIAQTGHGDVAYTAPVAYQTINQQRIDVPVRYVLGKGKQHSYQFALGEYDRSAPLVIDPLIQSTYLGGNNYDQANALVVADGDVLVAGWTSSTNFPGTNGGAQAAHAADGGGRDAFVSRLSGDLKTLRQSTYLGGSGDDYAYPLAVDSTTGDVLVAGYTYSTNFPGTSGGTQAAHGGGSIDAFVSRLSGDLKTLVQSTYLGGSHDDFARSVAVASNGDVLVAGGTLSTNFPGTSAGAQAASGGGNDAFVARLSGDLKAVSPQAITFGVQPSQTFASGGTFVLNPVATASSDLPVSYTSITPAVCTISGTTVTMASAGTCTIQAGQAGNASWQAATPVTQSITITQGSQTITFGPQPSQTYTSGGTFALNPAATASSGLSVSYTSTTPAVCTISGTTVTMLSVGACTITASQAGNASWQAATPVSQSITINQGTQAINFGAQPSQTYASGGTFTLNPVATASSGLPVSYTSATPTVCSISGTTVTMLSAGTCTITASQAGNASWQAAAPVSQSVNVTVPVPTPVPANAPWALLLATLGVAGLMASGLRVRRQGHLGQCLRGDR